MDKIDYFQGEFSKNTEYSVYEVQANINNKKVKKILLKDRKSVV